MTFLVDHIHLKLNTYWGHLTDDYAAIILDPYEFESEGDPYHSHAHGTQT